MHSNEPPTRNIHTQRDDPRQENIATRRKSNKTTARSTIPSLRQRAPDPRPSAFPSPRPGKPGNRPGFGRDPSAGRKQLNVPTSVPPPGGDISPLQINFSCTNTRVGSPLNAPLPSFLKDYLSKIMKRVGSFPSCPSGHHWGGGCLRRRRHPFNLPAGFG